MLLTCPSCNVSYELSVTLPDEGRKVRCAQCGNVWTAYPGDDTAQELESAVEPEVEEPETDQVDLDEFGEGLRSMDDESEEIEPFAPDLDVEEFDIEFKEEELPVSEDLLQGGPDEDAEDQDQSAIDALMDAASDGAEDADDDSGNDQSDIDALFGDADDEPQSQDGIDDLMAAAEEEEVEEPAAPEIAAEPEEAAVEMTAPVEPPAAAQPPLVTPPPKEKPAEGAKRKTAMLAAGWGAIAATLIGIAGFAYFNSSGVVSTIPGSAQVYDAMGAPVNVRGLEFRGVSYSWEAEAGQPVLNVKGSVVNLTDKTMRVPKVIFALRDEQGAELFNWTKSVYQAPLSAGQSAPFVTRIPSPPMSVRSLQVRFAKAKTN